MIINLNEYLKFIKNLDYALVKIDVPYMTKDFPNSYPIGKDLDIIIRKEHFNNIINITNNFIKKFNYTNIFNIRIIQLKNNVKFRFIVNYKLHYQFDITIDESNLLLNKQIINNYYLLSLENEIKIREYEIKKNPNKLHHKEWLLTNKI